MDSGLGDPPRTSTANRPHSSGVLGRKTAFSLWVVGPVGVAELTVLIRKLEIDRDILIEDAAKLTEAEHD